jgi:drug/metabolite transporter (DMT)-like permease
MPPAVRTPVIRAALWMSGALVSFSAMAIAGRELSAEMSIFQLLAIRSIAGLLLLAALLQRSGWAQVRTRMFGTHLLRNVAHFGGGYAWFYGVGLISLTEVFAIEFTVPIWTAIMATIFLGERMSRRRAVAVALGFAGILVMLRPGVAAVSVPALAVLGGALGFAVAYVFMKRLSASETPLAILFYMNAIQLPLGLVPALPQWVWPPAGAWPWVGVVAVAGLWSHYCLARAFRLADASVVVPLDFLRLPLIAVVGFVFYGEALSIWVLAGALIVCFATWLNLRSSHHAVPARSASKASRS